jgi:hypothetical protein
MCSLESCRIIIDDQFQLSKVHLFDSVSSVPCCGAVLTGSALNCRSYPSVVTGLASGGAEGQSPTRPGSTGSTSTGRAFICRVDVGLDTHELPFEHKRAQCTHTH